MPCSASPGRCPGRLCTTSPQMPWARCGRSTRTRSPTGSGYVVCSTSACSSRHTSSPGRGSSRGTGTPPAAHARRAGPVARTARAATASAGAAHPSPRPPHGASESSQHRSWSFSWLARGPAHGPARGAGPCPATASIGCDENVWNAWWMRKRMASSGRGRHPFLLRRRTVPASSPFGLQDRPRSADRRYAGHSAPGHDHSSQSVRSGSMGCGRAAGFPAPHHQSPSRRILQRCEKRIESAMPHGSA